MEPSQLMDTYISLRDRGMSRGAALNHLYGHLCKLPSTDAKSFVNQVQALEAGQQIAVSRADETRKLTQDEEPQAEVGITCGVCGWVNPSEATICTQCNTHLPQAEPNTLGTSTLYPTPTGRTVQFTSDMWLMLRIPNQHVKFELDPYNTERELLVGRSDTSRVVDVDLNDHAGVLLGVSRRHMGLMAAPELNRLIARDLGSRNGLFRNGKRVPTHASTYLQHGDQLELGRLILLVFFIYR